MTTARDVWLAVYLGNIAKESVTHQDCELAAEMAVYAFCKRFGEDSQEEENASEGGWTPWHGGENPVPGKLVQISWHNTHQKEGDHMLSDHVFWGEREAEQQVTAYRVIGDALTRGKT